MYKIRITDLDELKQRRTTGWAKLHQVVVAAVFRQISDSWVFCTI